MPEFHMRLRRAVRTIELVDVVITAESGEKAMKKVYDLFDADEVVSTEGTDFGEALDNGSWEHDVDGDVWEMLEGPPDTQPIPYQGEKTDPVNLDNFRPAVIEEDELHDD